MWSKFLFIAALSGVGALTRAPVGIIRAQPESRQLLHGALTEIHAVAAGHGIALPADIVEQTLAYWTRCRPTAPPPCSATSCTAVPRSSTRKWEPW